MDLVLKIHTVFSFCKQACTAFKVFIWCSVHRYPVQVSNAITIMALLTFLKGATNNVFIAGDKLLLKFSSFKRCKKEIVLLYMQSVR